MPVCGGVQSKPADAAVCTTRITIPLADGGTHIMCKCEGAAWTSTSTFVAGPTPFRVGSNFSARARCETERAHAARNSRLQSSLRVTALLKRL